MTDTYETGFPLSCVNAVLEADQRLARIGDDHAHSHPHCAIGTYFFVDQNKHGVPVTRFIDVGSMLKDMDLLARKAGKATFKFYTKMQAWNSLRKHFHEGPRPSGPHLHEVPADAAGHDRTSVTAAIRARRKASLTRALMVAGMHFMDSYNYDVERVKRCLIHYAAPDGKIYPFCTYNSGPCYREKIGRPTPFRSRARNHCGR
jgi:uncharacterized radical SAM superfamily Fe-S cluster-containing enzyme